MREKFEKLSFGGQNKNFFKEQEKAIHSYNSNIINILLIIMTLIIGAYVLLGIGTELFSKYIIVYKIYFVILLAMLLVFKKWIKPNPKLTKLWIWLFITIVFSFVCILGTVFEPNTRATLFIVYILAIPMLFIIPTIYMYTFLLFALIVFSVITYIIKPADISALDITHGITCFILGLMISYHILKSRIELLYLNIQLEKLGKVDALTGIANRHSLDEFIQKNYEKSSKVTVAMMDLDDFKKYNDFFGHQKGDSALKHVARIIELKAMDEGIFVARFGGEEFILVALDDKTNDMEKIFQGICMDLYNKNIGGDDDFKKRLTISVGYSEKNENENFEDVLKRADEALYLAKKNGKNRVEHK